MIIAAGLASVALFAVALSFLRVIDAASAALATAQRAVDVMRDDRVDDRDRERAMRRASLRLFAAFGSILGRGLLAVAFAALPIWAIDVVGVVSAENVLAFLTRWDVIILSMAAFVLGLGARAFMWRFN